MDQNKTIQRIDELIKQTQDWLVFHREHKNKIEAMACAIRINALKEAQETIKSISR